MQASTTPRRAPQPQVEIAKAGVDDLDRIVEIENASFALDRLSRRSLRYLLTRAHADTLVARLDGVIAGYATVLYRSATSLARLYSIATDPDWRGHGAGARLIEAAEAAAMGRGAVEMRLEVHPKNDRAIGLYRAHGYTHFDDLPDYYEDHATALRFQKVLHPPDAPRALGVPYYEQTLDFTCGPAALMMAMSALDPDLELDRMLELRLWREATTIFMTTGHGGCGPMGLALAAVHRGFGVEVWIRSPGTLFVDSVRNDDKKEVMRIVQTDMENELAQAGVPIRYMHIGIGDIRDAIDRGAMVLLLISSWRLYEERFPHWVVVTGFGDRHVSIHDPYVDYERNRSVSDSVNLPIPIEEFARMLRYGRADQQAAVIIYPSVKEN
ncbi:MAG: peptidase C39 family protein [Chromatiales bacterium]|nr:peptidase C39 family protein [Chromatiales bacterium]